MNKEQTKDCLRIMQAFLDGKQIQYLDKRTDTWKDADSGVSWDWWNEKYRIKPTPTLRPWKPEEVPVGALLRQKSKSSVVLIVAESYGDIICYAHEQYDYRMSPKEALQENEYSLDHGKTWLPCALEEQQ